MIDYYDLIRKLQTVRGKDFSQNQAEEMVASFKKIPFSAAQWIVKSITRQAQLPNNLYGVVLDRVDDEFYRRQKAAEQKDDWNAQQGCMTPEEWKIGMGCISKAISLQIGKEWLEQFAVSCEQAAGDMFLNFLKSTDAILSEEISKRVIV
jgi:hypothetical protein